MIGLINDFALTTGSGNYAFSIFRELKKNTDVEMNYINYEPKKLNEKNIITEKPFPLPLLKRTLNSAIFLPKKMEKYELIHCTNQMLSNYAKFNKNSVITCFDLIPIQTPKDYPLTTSFFLRKAIKALDKAKKVITISEYSKKVLNEIGKVDLAKINVIYPGVNQKEFYPKNKIESRKKLGLPEKSEIILNVGSEEKRKNIETLIDAFEIISKKNNNAFLLRVGENTPRIQKKIMQKNLEKKVIYLNRINNRLLSSAYSSADIFVYPCTLDAFGLTTMEAMSCGTPLISSLKTSLAETIPEEFGIEDPTDPEEISEKIQRILSNENYAKKNSEKGIEWSKKFTWKKCAEQTKSVYESLI